MNLYRRCYCTVPPQFQLMGPETDAQDHEGAMYVSFVETRLPGV